MNVDEVSASEIIDEYIITYGKYVISEMFPNMIDSLKSVIRRSLWCLRDTNNGFTSSQNALGKIFKLHPHSPDATYKSIVRLTQMFSTIYPLFEIKGDEGSYSGDRYANYRYTSMKISDFAYDVFFKDVDTTTLDYIMGDDLFTFEPKYLIPKIPMTLLQYNHSIGFGFTSIIPSYDISDIRDLIHRYFEYKDNKLKKETFNKMSNKIIPVFPIENNIINTNSITLEGKLEFLNHSTFFLKNIPFANNISTIKTKLLMMMKNGIIDEFKAVSNRKEEANIMISIKNNKDQYNTFFKVLSTIGFIMKATPIPNFSNGDCTINLNKFNLIESWAEERRRMLVSQINNRIISVKQKIRETYCYLLISGDIDYVISTIKNNDEKTARLLLKKKFDISLNQSNIILNTPLKTLSKNNKAELEERYKVMISRKNKYINSINDIDNTIITDVDALTKKYTRKKFISKVPKYIGYISIDNTLLIQYDSYDELDKLLGIFKNKHVNVFDDNIGYKYMISFPSSFNKIEDNRKYRLGYRYLNNKNNHTLIVNPRNSVLKKGYKSDLVNFSTTINNNSPVIFFENKYIRKGNLFEIADIKKIKYMKNLKDDVEKVLIVSFNTKIKNKIRFQYMETKSLPKSIISSLAIKNTKILDIIDLRILKRKELYLNVPFCYNEYFSRSYFKISNVSSSFLKEPFIEKTTMINIKL